MCFTDSDADIATIS